MHINQDIIINGDITSVRKSIWRK